MKPIACSLFVVVLAVSAPAAAAVCVEVDRASDTLEPSDANAVLRLVEAEFRKQGEEVVPAPCNAQYTVYNIKLGRSVQAFISGPRGERDGRVNRVEDLSRIYAQMVRSLLTGVPMSNDGAVARDTVTADQAAPRRVAADSLWYLRLGAGSVAGGDFNLGPVFGGGYRYELDRFGIDVSANLYFGTENDTENDSIDLGISGSLLKLMALYFIDPTASSSPYVGLGISYGGVAVTAEDNEFTGAGLQGEVSVGYELLRASTIRMFVAADATLPFYNSTPDLFGGRGDPRYTPAFALSLGFAFGGDSNTQNVNITGL
ncbi:MAG: outer membrane beta-barrel protein [Myxococcota bacterium]